MRTFMISLAAAGAALAIASPAAAQYYPAPQPAPYGYNQPYGYNNGYNVYGRNNWGQVRELQVRLDNIERQISRLDRRDRLSERNADRLRNQANDIERRLHRVGRNGLNPYEANEIQIRIANLEQRVQIALSNRYGRDRYGYNDRDGHWGRDRDRD